MDIDKIFNKSIQNFPRWMDIRKRHNKSNGGQYFHSIIDELKDVEQELYEYKKEFFAINYIGKEDSIIDYVYYCNVGELDLNDFVIINPKTNITTDFKNFYLKHNDAYYQNGILYFLRNQDKITYQYNNEIYDITLQKMHVWNIFDEFALFIGLQRFENETNKELLNRVFRVFKHNTNSTEEGLKNTILNTLANKNKNLSKDDIKINKPSTDNLYKMYNEYNTIIDFLINFNQDVYRSKVWDKSLWSHDFVDLEYAPVKWDEYIENKSNGVGHNAFESNFINSLDKPNNTVIVDIYEQSQQAIQEYIRKNRIKTNIELQLKKYNDVIKKKEVSYKILASEALDITNEQIDIECYNKTRRYKNYKIEDLIDNIDDYKSYIKKPISLKKDHKYKLEFYPKNGYEHMEINHIKLIDDSTEQDLLSDQIKNRSHEIISPMTILNNQLFNERVKFYSTSLDGLEHSSNMTEKLDSNNIPYITLDDNSKNGEMIIDITNMDNNYCIIPINIDTVSILKDRNKIKYDGEVNLINNKIITNGKKNNSIYINTTFKQLNIMIDSGDCKVIGFSSDNKIIYEKEYYSNDKRNISLNNEKINSIRIIPIGINDLIISDIRYNDYDITYETKIGQIEKAPDGIILPNVKGASNSLKVTITNKIMHSPQIPFIFIGYVLNRYKCYHTLEFTNNLSDTAYANINSTCKIKLIDVDENKIISDNYNSALIFENKENIPKSIILNLKNINDIQYSSTWLTRVPGSSNEYSLILPAKNQIQNIAIYGTLLQPIKNIDLTQHIKDKYNNNIKIYISNIIDGYIILDEENSTESVYELDKTVLGEKTNHITINTNNTEITPLIILDKEKNNRVLNNKYSNSFSYIGMYNNNGIQYVSNNKNNIYKTETNNIIMNQVFAPILNTKKSIVYKIITPNNYEDINISFSNNNKWSLDQKDIKIKLAIDLSSYDTYDYTIHNSNNYVVLSNRVSFSDINKDFSEYIITPPEYIKINYDTKQYQETVMIKEDGFNKLKFANVLAVDSITVNDRALPNEDYTLLNDGGYIVWNNSTLTGLDATINYSYKVPKEMLFIDYSYIYKQINYNVDAYKFVNHIEKNTTTSFKIKYNPENYKIIVYCTNKMYIASVDKDRIIINKRDVDNLDLAINTGYYYDNNKEYYYLIDNNPKDKIIKNKYFESNDADFINNELFLHQESKNYLTHSAMDIGYKDTICKYNFNNKYNINELSHLKELTACDNYTKWISFNNIILIDNESLLFKKENESIPLSYSYLELPIDNKNTKIITLYASDPENLYIGATSKYIDQKLNNTNCIEIIKNKASIDNRYSYFILNNISEHLKYYLIVANKNKISDIIVKDYSKYDNIKKLHTKIIDTLKLDIKEKNTIGSKSKLYFDVNNSSLFQTDITADNSIATDSSVQWGLTKAMSYKNKLNELKTKNVVVTNDILYSKKGTGIVKTKAIRLSNKDSIKNIIISINDILTQSTKDFDINVYGANSDFAKYKLISQSKKTNKIVLPHDLLTKYIKIEVIMDEGKIINNIEYHFEYFENENEQLQVNKYNYGFFESKLYDTGYIQNIKIDKININNIEDKENVNIFVRSYKKDRNNFVYNDWIKLKIDNDGNIINECILYDTRYLQFKIELASDKALVNIDSFYIEVK